MAIKPEGGLKNGPAIKKRYFLRLLLQGRKQKRQQGFFCTLQRTFFFMFQIQRTLTHLLKLLLLLQAKTVHDRSSILICFQLICIKRFDLVVSVADLSLDVAKVAQITSKKLCRVHQKFDRNYV